MSRAARWIACPLILTVAAASGCHLRSDSAAASGAAAPAAAADEDAATQKRIVLVAPVALGPLAGREPQARQVFADELADRLNLLVTDLAANAPDSLPDADAKDWNAGPVPAASDSTLVVLTRVVESVLQPDGSVEAVVEMKAFDPSDAADPVFFKKARGHGAAGATGMLGGLEEDAEVAAAWEACTTLSGALVQVLAAKPAEGQPAPTPPAGTTVSVEVDSEPAGADIEIDGKFAGNTPTRLDLPQRSLTVHLELRGKVWERQLVPVEGMRIQPLLAAAAAAPATAAAPAAASGADQPETKEPQPVRAQVDSIPTPPPPDHLVVPDAK